MFWRTLPAAGLELCDSSELTDRCGDRFGVHLRFDGPVSPPAPATITTLCSVHLRHAQPCKPRKSPWSTPSDSSLHRQQRAFGSLLSSSTRLLLRQPLQIRHQKTRLGACQPARSLPAAFGGAAVAGICVQLVWSAASSGLPASPTSCSRPIRTYGPLPTPTSASLTSQPTALRVSQHTAAASTPRPPHLSARHRHPRPPLPLHSPPPSVFLNTLPPPPLHSTPLFRLHLAEGGRPLGRCQAAFILTTIAFATLY